MTVEIPIKEVGDGPLYSLEEGSDDGSNGQRAERPHQRAQNGALGAGGAARRVPVQQRGCAVRTADGGQAMGVGTLPYWWQLRCPSRPGALPQTAGGPDGHGSRPGALPQTAMAACGSWQPGPAVLGSHRQHVQETP